MPVDEKCIVWLHEAADRVQNGHVGLVVHIRKGAVAWIEKIHRTTEKPEEVKTK
jgi:hypothetical protein